MVILALLRIQYMLGVGIVIYCNILQYVLVYYDTYCNVLDFSYHQISVDFNEIKLQIYVCFSVFTSFLPDFWLRYWYIVLEQQYHG